MRRIQFIKVLVPVMVIAFFLTGCSAITGFDKNKNSYITEPFNTVDDSTQTE